MIFRNCSNPVPQYGGMPCIGLALDTILCNVSNVSCPSKDDMKHLMPSTQFDIDILNSNGTME